MTAKELYAAICAMGGEVLPDTVDTCKAGEINHTVEKLAVCFIATPNVIREAAAWGADMLLTHEPTYYTNDDTMDNDVLTLAKKELVEQSGMVICRYHDGLHNAECDVINVAFIRQAGLSGAMADKMHLSLADPQTARELAMRIKVRCGLKSVRVVGDTAHAVRTVGLYLGAPDGSEVLRDIKEGHSDCIVIGEVCEWSIGEYVRDAAQMGMPLSMIIVGHVGAERDGMRLIADELTSRYPLIETRYFESGEIYN